MIVAEPVLFIQIAELATGALPLVPEIVKSLIEVPNKSCVSWIEKYPSAMVYVPKATLPFINVPWVSRTSNFCFATPATSEDISPEIGIRIVSPFLYLPLSL